MFNKEDEELEHFSHTEYTPIRSDAFVLSPEEKQKAIQDHFAKIMQILGLDMNDDSLKDTPKRVAKIPKINPKYLHSKIVISIVKC